MVVLHHNELDRTLWGPASTVGRSRATDIAIYIQLVGVRVALVALLGITSALDYDKPEAVRLAAAGVALLMYFRSTALFIRLMMFVCTIILYGDVLVPVIRIARAGEVLPLQNAKLLLHCIWIWNMMLLRPSANISSAKGKQSLSFRIRCPRARVRTRLSTMRGGLFLFPLYVDPQDASAADAREEVQLVASQPAAHAEAVNPQRLATLIRSSTTGRLSSADETTEIDADVLNSLPKWAQAVVQTGCFNSGAVHGPKPSPKNKLKRKLELQGEQDCEQPRKRRSFGNGVSAVNPIKDENGELQDCLDELNAEPDVDVEMDDEDELPTFSTQAEIAADSVEKYADLLEGLLEKATQRQGLENFERDNLDVFSPQEVKLLLQTMKTLEKNDWINELEPAILIALMSTLDVQVRLGLAVDVLGAALPKGEEGKPQQSKIDRALVSSILTSLDVAICELIVMTRPEIDRRVLSEENLENCFQLLHHITRRLILPCIDTTYVTTASTPVAEEEGRRRLSGAKMSSSSRVNLRVNKHIRKAVDQVSHVFCEFMDHLAALVLSVKLANRWVLPLSAAMVELFALEHSPYATSLQQSALTILRAIFKQYKSHRDALLEDLVAVMVKLPTTKRTLRTVKLASSSDSVQQISTLVVSMVQSCVPAGKLEAVESDPVFQESSEPPSTPDTVSEEKPLKMDVAEAALGETRNSAQSLVRTLLKACWKKNEDRDNRVVLENFVEDLVVMFVRPEWIGAEDILEALCSSLASVLHANISADERNPDSHKSLAALNLVGKVCAAIKRYQTKVDHGAVVDDSDSTAVVEEHKNCLREAIVGKKTRSRKALPSACSDLVDLLAFKHIVVMHLQRKGSDQCDSRKLLLLKFMSEAKTHWSDLESAYMDREYTLWKKLMVETKGATNSTFKVAIPTTELALRASLHLAVKRRFCGLFDGLLAHIMALLSRAAPSLRARVMKCLRGIVDVDPMLMAESGVRSAVERCCSDEKPSVREAAVDLIGTYVLLQPVLFDKYFDVLAERMRDKGIKVRKSVCKIFKIALTAMQEQSHDADSEQELRRKSACMRCLVERVGDASEDQGVKNFIIDTFQEVWFGSELSSSKLSNPLSEFGDGSTLPPGWTAVAIEDKSDAPEINSKYVSENGVVVNSVEEAWSSYRTPMVTPASVVKINDAKMDNSSEVVATIVEVIHGMPNLGWFAELLKRLLRGRSNGTRETAVRSVKNRSAEIAIAEDRSEKIIDRLVNCLMDLQEGTLLIGVSIKDGHEQFVACMTALSVFCEAKPELLTRHLETIRVYLKEKDAMILNLSVSMIDSILRVKRVSLSIASRLEEDLKYLILHSPPSVVGPSVKCLATLSKTTKKAPVLLLQLLENFVLRMRQHKQIKALSSLSEKDNRALQRALFAAGKIVGATDMDNIQELVRETTVLQIGTITASLYELYKPFICAPDNDKCSAMAVQGMGFLFPIRPRLFLRAQQDELLKHLLTPPFPEKRTKTFQCLVSMKELLLSEEQRLENGMASRSMDRSKSKEQQVQGDQEADASLIGSVMQAELDSILLLSVQKIPQIRKEAVACIGALLTQGLVNPLQCIQNLVALETDRVSDVRDAAFSQLLALYERFRSEIHTPLIKGIHGSYSFQLGVYGNATALGIDDNKKEYCLFGRLYSTCLKPTKSHGSLLLKSLINQFTDQGSALKPLKATLATDNSKNFTSRLKYLSYLAQIISTLPYDVEDEPLYVIYLINQYASLRLGPVLDDMKEVFATAGVAPEQLEDEAADLSKINIDEYRPLGSLPRFKLAALKTNGCIAFALALMLRLKFALKRNYQLDNEKCATYKPSSRDPPVEARERSPKKLLLPSVDDLCQTDDPIELSWNLFMTAWLTARKDERQLDIDLQGQEKLKASPKRRRRSRKVVAWKQQHSSENDSNEDDEFVNGFA